eukprot:CAMPEP_0170562944 /NCGR_PEP_ID=MMETSP0211-20121228/63421_1 /TAXON_ID=311385 /ORGANISM="Pseudokeronopsis sp., Strain OXSARD2" /LENGTH=262 /DNA_ID=CAMNT_0010880531 /DNA_START=877 /DNA_END=1664 /DNA_ORIENTATION=-
MVTTSPDSLSRNLSSKFEFEERRVVKKANKNGDNKKEMQTVFELEEEDPVRFFILVKSILRKTFMNIQQCLQSQQRFDIDLSGSTLVIFIVTQVNILTANCGDSRGIIIDKKGRSLFETRDHKPERFDERQRIEVKYRGKVKEQFGDHKVPILNEKEIKLPLRVWSQYINMPGLAMSRSLGDTMGKQLGVISDPEVSIYPLKDPKSLPQALFLASDGVWDVMASYEVSDFIRGKKKEGCEAKSCAESIILECNRRWQKKDFN